MAKKNMEQTSYEYFKVDEMFFVGKHRDYVDKLWTQGKIQESFFKRLVDLYAIAAIVGLKAKRRSSEERDESDIKRTDQMKQLNENYTDFRIANIVAFVSNPIESERIE